MLLIVGEIMGLAIVKTCTLVGMEALNVTVEVHLANGLPAFSIVGNKSLLYT
ncbi:hypothetical protein [Agarivorans sp. 1_MG-2023]|uniref:hypothetical protein n=1 Tax=Agarivorans sp. 1_MG-2023 TaxID=3062634 RepID=UPI0026E3AF34|nr:hypothetical protein [Agarivorans sp. 1_MG-2023]MDO6763401.1 hypothetical protein [Agarivorans sp. 1_MG-2023]